ncbi:hypothetical protein OU5_P0310 (plasmid) [Pseudomonas mandelii JR-1]|uniref:Uncharacterized protein n=1 Tax=Pseudomonas mandelii JR-1 TaxID=1147786 RepID=A0A024ELA1_9PSED|nr:hypothetical protein OU5_P0310 [Pseudomonas mandelii JR-1]
MPAKKMATTVNPATAGVPPTMCQSSELYIRGHSPGGSSKVTGSSGLGVTVQVPPKFPSTRPTTRQWPSCTGIWRYWQISVCFTNTVALSITCIEKPIFVATQKTSTCQVMEIMKLNI